VVDDTDRKPHLRLAVENKQADIDRELAKRDIEWPLRELAANLIRVVRGAGKSYEIVGQCVAVIEAFQKYREKVGYLPSSWEMDQALSIHQDDEKAIYDEAWEREDAVETMVCGALQIAASRLVDQRTQEHRGRSELMDGFYALERIREEARKRFARAERAKKAPRKKPGKRTVMKRRGGNDPDIKL
jgi:hypothetical protein